MAYRGLEQRPAVRLSGIAVSHGSFARPGLHALFHIGKGIWQQFHSVPVSVGLASARVLELRIAVQV